MRYNKSKASSTPTSTTNFSRQNYFIKLTGVKTWDSIVCWLGPRRGALTISSLTRMLQRSGVPVPAFRFLLDGSSSANRRRTVPSIKLIGRRRCSQRGARSSSSTFAQMLPCPCVTGAEFWPQLTGSSYGSRRRRQRLTGVFIEATEFWDISELLIDEIRSELDSWLSRLRSERGVHCSSDWR
jgi:hypothetical protein